MEINNNSYNDINNNSKSRKEGKYKLNYLYTKHYDK